MKAKFIFLLFIVFSLRSNSQIATIFSGQLPDSVSRIGLSADYSIGSNNLTNEFIGKFYNGGFISNELKNSVLNKTKNSNRIGADVNYGVFAVFKMDSLFPKNHCSFFINVKDRQHFDAGFSKDLYKVGFYGNASYAGKTADFNGFSMNLLRYQQVQIGFFSSQSDSVARWGVGLSFLKGEQYANVSAKTAELFTSEDGQYIDFNTSIMVAQSDTAKKGFTSFNGAGASADVYFEAPFKGALGYSKIILSVSDVGLIRFDRNSLSYAQDSMFHYDGFHVTSIYDLQSSSYANSGSNDSIINTIAPRKKQSVSATLPAILNFSFQTKFSQNFELTEGLHYVFNANYKLQLFVKGDYYFSKRFVLSATVSHGGYSNFNYGVGVFANIGSGFVIYAGSNNIEGYIFPKKTTAQGAYVSVIRTF